MTATAEADLSDDGVTQIEVRPQTVLLKPKPTQSLKTTSEQRKCSQLESSGVFFSFYSDSS